MPLGALSWTQCGPLSRARGGDPLLILEGQGLCRAYPGLIQGCLLGVHECVPCSIPKDPSRTSPGQCGCQVVDFDGSPTATITVNTGLALSRVFSIALVGTFKRSSFKGTNKLQLLKGQSSAPVFLLVELV